MEFKSQFRHDFPFQNEQKVFVAASYIKIEFCPESTSTGFQKIIEMMCPRCREKMNPNSCVCEGCGLTLGVVFQPYVEGNRPSESEGFYILTKESLERIMEHREKAKREDQYRLHVRQEHREAIVKIVQKAIEIKELFATN